MSLPPLELDPPASEAEDARLDVSRERRVLAEEAVRDVGGDDPASGGPSTASGGTSDERGDPTSLENAARRVASAPDDPSVAKYARMGYPRDAVVLGVAMWGDDQGRVVDFCEGFARVADMGFGPEIVAGALASCDNDVDRALGSLLR